MKQSFPVFPPFVPGVVTSQPPLPAPIGPANPLPPSYGGSGVSTTNANRIFAGPIAGGMGAPSFRQMVNADLPPDFSIQSAPLSAGDFRLVLTQSSTPGIYQRWYASYLGDFYLAWNASYNNTTDLWTQDSAGSDSYVYRIGVGNFRIRRKLSGAAPWADSSWDFEDIWYGAYSQSSTTRIYPFRFWFSGVNVGQYLGGDIQFSTEFPTVPTSLSFAVTNSSGVDTNTLYAWDVHRGGCGYGVVSTLANGWIGGILTVGY